MEEEEWEEEEEEEEIEDESLCLFPPYACILPSSLPSSL